MKTYLISLTRGDAAQEYPIEMIAENIGTAIVKAVEQSYQYHPNYGDAAFCLVSVHEMVGEKA
jgi:hypothetical protein